MIRVAGKTLQAEDASAYASSALEKAMFHTLLNSRTQYQYDSPERLKFELRLRREIINAAREQYRSGLNFAVFRKSKCNPAYWERTREGGFRMKPGVKASDAIRDIFENGSQYATECATALLILYYKALLNMMPEDAFNKTFPSIYLMNWHRIDRILQEVGNINRASDYLPGDRRYFMNPDVDPLTPEWQGENVIDLGDGTYYGHGIGIGSADNIIKVLNQNRMERADDSAYLMDSAGRPDFDKLYNIYRRSAA
ncbi:MAG: protein-glutamine gamma-glutamyltransferase [Ruminococcaceae bacterium]|nr:protein-glutamine gamma-glutamyltransferase [Oscillospiraceae bacterium]